MSSKKWKVTTAADWKEARRGGIEVPLPSGDIVKIRPANVMKMIRAGTIPDLLSDIALRSVWVEQNPEEIGDSMELAGKYEDLMGIVIPAVLASPKVALPGEEPEDDEITMDDIDISDRTSIFNLALAGVGAMRKFRDEQKKLMDALSNVNEDGDAA